MREYNSINRFNDDDLTLVDNSRSGRPPAQDIEPTKERRKNQPSTNTRRLSGSFQTPTATSHKIIGSSTNVQIASRPSERWSFIERIVTCD
ncbi:hypothetical protein EVAR_16785_1 [Eumeta japonica]|uniref:Uncharacterized protein n=1 Tax=Eumeta variegata TaxID=151549 RepID=A0A4C1UML3_EUMVA|nr:hypothetical protein EVAR_16785_1 [Eumeta japonica]